MKNTTEIKALATTTQPVILTGINNGSKEFNAAYASGSAASGSAESTGATAGSAASTGAAAGSTTSTGATASAGSRSNWRNKFHTYVNQLKVWSKSVDRIMSKFARMLGKLFWALLIAYVIGYFVPDLREKMPDFYSFVDTGLDCFNYLWKGLIAFTKWWISLITFGAVNL